METKILKNISETLKKSLSETDIKYSKQMIKDLKHHGYKFIKILGTGGFCVVGLFEKNNQQYAVKIFNHERLSFNLLKQIDDINVYMDKYLENCQENSKFVLDYKFILLNGNYYVLSEPLDSSLIDFMSKTNTTQNKMKVSCQIVKALKCLHSMKIIHGDLKPDNIFIKNRNKHIKIGDFDGSGIFKKKEVMIYTRLYLHPSIKDVKKYSFKYEDDIFAVGLIIVCLFDSRISKFLYRIDERLDVNTLKKLISLIEISKDIPSGMKILLKKMLNKKEKNIEKIEHSLESICYLFKNQLKSIKSFKFNNIKKRNRTQKK